MLQNFIYLFILPPPGATQPIVGVYFTALYRALAFSRMRLLDHTQRRPTVGRTPLNERSAHRRDLYLRTHNTRNRQTSMPRVGFEPRIAAGERPIDLRLRPRSYWDRQTSYITNYIVSTFAGSNPAEVVGFFGLKNPQHAFLRRGSKRICPMSQLCGMSKNLVIYVKYGLLAKFQV